MTEATEVCVNASLAVVPSIASVEDNSASYADRVLVTLTNGAQLSVIRGADTYGGREGLYEIAPMYNGKLCGGLLGIECDDVEGWLTADDVTDRLAKLGAMTSEEVVANATSRFDRD